MTRLILGALIAALILAPVTAGIVLFDGAGAAGAAWQTPVTDTFDGNGSLGANWTNVDNGFSRTAGEAETTNVALALWDTNQLAAKQCACTQRASPPTASNTYCGPAVRYDSLSSTSLGYVARWTPEATPQTMVRYCSDASCTTIESWSNEIDESNWLCLCVDGSGSSTEFAVWERTTDPSAEDPTDWGDALRCIDDDASTVLWTACTTTSAWDTTPTYRNCSGDACYAGIYMGDSSDCEMDNWSARDYK